MNKIAPLSESLFINELNKKVTTPAWVQWFGVASKHFSDFANYSGIPVQRVSSTSSTPGSTDTTIPADNTKPLKTEGAELLTATVTPAFVGGKLIVKGYIALVSASEASVITVALFKDDESYAISTSAMVASAANIDSGLNVAYEETTTSLTAVTYKLRLGPSVGTAYWLRRAAGNVYNLTARMYLEVTEVTA